MKDIEIKKLAKQARLPNGWYNGPWFEGDKLKTGLAPCMKEFVRLIELSTNNKDADNGS